MASAEAVWEQHAIRHRRGSLQARLAGHMKCVRRMCSMRRHAWHWVHERLLQPRCHEASVRRTCGMYAGGMSQGIICVRFVFAGDVLYHG